MARRRSRGRYRAHAAQRRRYLSGTRAHCPSSQRSRPSIPRSPNPIVLRLNALSHSIEHIQRNAHIAPGHDGQAPFVPQRGSGANRLAPVEHGPWNARSRTAALIPNVADRGPRATGSALGHHFWKNDSGQTNPTRSQIVCAATSAAFTIWFNRRNGYEPSRYLVVQSLRPFQWSAWKHSGTRCFRDG